LNTTSCDFRGIGNLALRKNQSEQLPEPSSSPRNWKKLKNLSKPNASQKEFFGGKRRECARNTRKYERLGK